MTNEQTINEITSIMLLVKNYKNKDVQYIISGLEASKANIINNLITASRDTVQIYQGQLAIVETMLSELNYDNLITKLENFKENNDN